MNNSPRRTAFIERMHDLGADDAAIRIAQLALGASPKTCRACGAEFLIGPGTRKPVWTAWCSNACRDGPRDYRTNWEKATGVALKGGPTLENTLWRNNIRSMADLAKLSLVDILRIPNVGRTSARYIADALIENDMREAGMALWDGLNL